MSVKQIAVFVENHQGTLSEITDLLAASGIDLQALSISESQDFGILRMIVDDIEAAKRTLTEHKCVFSINDVIAVEVPHRPGGIAGVIRLLSDEEVNIEYLYAFVGITGKNATVVIRVKNTEKAESVLISNGYSIK